MKVSYFEGWKRNNWKFLRNRGFLRALNFEDDDSLDSPIQWETLMVTWKFVNTFWGAMLDYSCDRKSKGELQRL